MAETEPEAPADPPNRQRGREFIHHPVVVGTALALISGLIASVLFPAMTRSWQDRPRELALKRELVTDVSEAATNAISRSNTFAYANELEPKSRAERIQHLTRELSDWNVASSVIGSQLATYFGETTLPQQWAEYQSAIGTYIEYTSRADDRLSGGYFALLDHFRSVRFDDPQLEQERKDVIAAADAEAAKPQEVAPEPRPAGNAAPAGDAAPAPPTDPEGRIGGLYLLGYERDQIQSRILAADAAGFSHGLSIFGG